MEKVLVTGGAGFIGSHTVDALLEKGYHVRVIDNLDPRVHPQGQPAYVPQEIEFIEGDVCDKNAMERAMEEVSTVYHFAAYQDYMTDYSRFFRTNCQGTGMIYEIIREKRQDIRQVIVASSQAVYGEGQYLCGEHGLVQPGARAKDHLMNGIWEVTCPECGADVINLTLREEYANPYNAYALSKYSGEMTALRLGNLLGIPTVALRYSITQGPRQSLFNTYSGICRIFMLNIKNDKPPLIFEDGKQKRDFVHIRDVVAANMLILEREDMAGKVLNVGSGKPTTVLDYAAQLIDHMKSSLEPMIPGYFREGDVRHSVSSISETKNLGWKPALTLYDIFEDYIQWVESFTSLEDYFTKAEKDMRRAGVLGQVEMAGVLV